MTHLKKNLFGFTFQKLKSNFQFNINNELINKAFQLKTNSELESGILQNKDASNRANISNEINEANELDLLRIDQLKDIEITKNVPQIPERKRNSTNSTPYFEIKLPEYRLKQIKNNMYKNYRNNPHMIQQLVPIREWTDLPLSLRMILDSEFTIDWGKVTTEDVAKDMTVKFLSKLEDNEMVESVIIPAHPKKGSDNQEQNENNRSINPINSINQLYRNKKIKDKYNENEFDSDYAPLETTYISTFRNYTGSKAANSTSQSTESTHSPTNLLPATLCVSSQVGCSMQCSFCFTGTQKMKRNLTSGEIIGQFMNAQQIAFPKNLSISNIVFMGQGEFGYNYRNVKDAIEVFTEELGISGKKIIVSTCGVVPAMKKLTKEMKVNLAVSLHATNDELRDKIVPINRMFPLKELMEACKDFEQNSGKRLSFEYVMLDGINDSYEDAKNLVRLLKGLSCSVNLIPFNPWPGTPYKSSPNDRIVKFSQFLYYNKIPAPIRWSRGDDILAACGQLRSDEELKSNLLDTHPLYQKLDCTKRKVDKV